jgi:4'-phosphopantetheinyl transferase
VLFRSAAPLPPRLEPAAGALDLVAFGAAGPASPAARSSTTAGPAREPWSVLSPGERARADRFAFPRDRARFVAAHAALRTILGACLDLSPSVVRLREGPRGKPELDPVHRSPLRFNLSHSGDEGLVGITVGREVGVDLEVLRPVPDRREIARRFFTAREADALDAAPEEERDAAFLRCWVAKESYLKARGDGLHVPLDAFELEPPAWPVRLSWSTLEPDPARWRIETLQLDARRVAAVAAPHGAWTIRPWVLG